MAEDGHNAFVEVAPHPVLLMSIHDTLADRAAMVAGSLRRGQGGMAQMLQSMAEAWVHGVHVDWHRLFAGTAAHRVDLPTYPFQWQRYWLEPAAGLAELAALGLGSPDHPLLGAVAQVAGTGGVLLSGRVSLRTHPWLADHGAGESILLPGTAFLEVAIRAADEVGCATVEELTVHIPLSLPQRGGVQLQVWVGGSDATGRRSLSIYARSQTDAADAEWTCHVTGVVSADHAEPAANLPDEWPPAGSRPIPLEGLYSRLADSGFRYGPAFQGLKAAWLRANETFVEARLPDDVASEASRYGLHPALLDTALHAVALDALRLPFAWSRVCLTASGATALRARLTWRQPDVLSIAAFDDVGRPVVSVESLALRPVTPKQLTEMTSRAPEALFGVDWVEIPPATGHAAAPVGRYSNIAALITAIAGDTSFPAVIAVSSAGTDNGHPDMVAAVHDATRQTLALLQQWVSDNRLGACRLLIWTHGAVATYGDEDVPNPIDSAIWGFVRAAQLENPGRFILADFDDPQPSAETLSAVVATGEPQVAVRGATISVPRLTRVKDVDFETDSVWDPEGTVLVTGGAGTLAGEVAEHLVKHRGVRHLLLAGRRGPDTPGAAGVMERLAGLGAEVTITACDVAERDSVAKLLEQIPGDHPLTAVIHMAGVLDDGIVSSLDAARVDRVLRSKVDSAIVLHELTKDLALSAFVMFSSVSGVLGSPGQANYAAANAFLDGFAQYRRVRGFAATSLAWGLWTLTTEMSRHLTDGDRNRLARLGTRPLTSAEGMDLFDAGCRSGHAALVSVKLDYVMLASQAADATLHPMLRKLINAVPRRIAGGLAARDGESLVARLRRMPAEKRHSFMLDLVRTESAGVLGHAASSVIDVERQFQDLGFDSLIAVLLRNRLSALLDRVLPATSVFDYPTPTALARHLLSDLLPDNQERPAAQGAAPESGNGRQTSVESEIDDMDAARLVRHVLATAKLDELADE
jgi:NAD(P)-dependent dehydrogenase (short-subunit alcohol dehydrogenase family)